MAKKKANAAKSQSAGQHSTGRKGTPLDSGHQYSASPGLQFPYALYTSLLGVHNTLLLFATFFLPQSLPRIEQASSRDRPQHPFLDALTSDPTLTALSISAGAAVLQSWWAGWIRRWSWGKDGEAGKLKGIRDAWVCTLIGTSFVYAFLILLGAPLADYIPQSLSLAVLISILAVFPSAYTIGSPLPLYSAKWFVWLRLFTEFDSRTPTERALAYPFVGTFVGAWLGAVPLALDWDRPWQAYPLPPALGAVLGYIIASLWAMAHTGFLQLAIEGRKLKTS